MLTIALILTWMAYAERLLGSMRAAVPFVVTGVLGVIASNSCWATTALWSVLPAGWLRRARNPNEPRL